MIQKNIYRPEGSKPKKIVLIGKEFFKGIKDQVDKLYNTGLLKDKPENLFKVVDSPEEILQNLPGIKAESSK